MVSALCTLIACDVGAKRLWWFARVRTGAIRCRWYWSRLYVQAQSCTGRICKTAICRRLLQRRRTAKCCQQTQSLSNKAHEPAPVSRSLNAGRRSSRRSLLAISKAQVGKSGRGTSRAHKGKCKSGNQNVVQGWWGREPTPIHSWPTSRLSPPEVGSVLCRRAIRHCRRFRHAIRTTGVWDLSQFVLLGQAGQWQTAARLHQPATTSSLVRKWPGNGAGPNLQIRKRPRARGLLYVRSRWLGPEMFARRRLPLCAK
jgi:hypothetical protein